MRSRSLRSRSAISRRLEVGGRCIQKATRAELHKYKKKMSNLEQSLLLDKALL